MYRSFVLCHSDGFYLCRTQQHVYDRTTSFSIQWLEEDPKAKHTYVMAFLDTTDIACVLIKVKLQRVDKDKFLLPDTQLAKVKKSLAETASGVIQEMNDDVDNDDDDDEEEKYEEEGENDGKCTG